MYWLLLHAGFMVAAVGSLLAGITIAMSYRRRRWWFKAHRRIESAGMLLMAIGFLMAVLMVSSHGGDHFDAPHPWIGIVAFLAAGSNIVLGLLLTHYPNRAAMMRKAHRWLGRSSAMVALINALLGLSLVLF